MGSSFFVFMRQLRRPLLVLIATYSVCTLGFVVIPATDELGRSVRLDFMHAFYLVSFTATTIGFGEIPYPFNAAQRLWMLFTIYTTVSGWLYSFGSVIAILQDPGLRKVIAERRFRAQVRDIGRPFYLLCGYGDTGRLVVRELVRYRLAAVVIELGAQRLDALALEDFGVRVPAVRGDASQPQTLVDAGLTHPQCLGVLGLTGSDEANLAIAMSARLLNPRIPAICRTSSPDTAANMASFGTRHIVDPFIAFADRLGLTFRAPSAHVIYECLTTSYRTPAATPVSLPVGLWVLCGYGRFGKPVSEALRAAGNTVSIIEQDIVASRAPPGTVEGRGTEEHTLRAAHAERAVGIVAGTNHGINNLSIVVTALEINPGIFTVARQTQHHDSLLFRQAKVDQRVQTDHIAASEAVELLRNPLLPAFLEVLMKTDEAWAAGLLQRMASVIGDRSPATWVVRVVPSEAPGVCASLGSGASVTLGTLGLDPRDRQRPLRALPLLATRGGRVVALPDDAFALQAGDEVLYCGRAEAEPAMQRTVGSADVLGYLLTGSERPSGSVWRLLEKRRPA